MSILQHVSSEAGDKTEESNRLVTKRCLQDTSLIPEIADGLKSDKTALIGDCAEVLTKIAEENPGLIVPYADGLIELLSHKTKRVRWEAMHAIALITLLIPDRISSISPDLNQLIEHDPSTIVRDWAIETVSNLAEISKNDASTCYEILKKALHVWDGKHRG